MDSLLIVDGEDINFIWDTIQEQQVVFHPRIAPDGKFDFKRFYASKNRKPFILFIDRNILISLLKFCEKGCLVNKGESQLVGLIMAWSELNNVAISAGLAIRERATQLKSQKEGLIELQKFLEVFETYPEQMWISVAEGRITEIPKIHYSKSTAKNITVDYASGGDHYDMAVASLLQVVQLYRNIDMKPFEKVKSFFEWMYDNLLISEYLLVYATLLFTEQENIRAPKNANSDDIEKIIAGCENLAWDISYLTNWSTLYERSETNDEEFLFATNDILLKRIFINKNAPSGLNGLLYEVFSKKDYNRLLDYIEEKMSIRIKPYFGDDPHQYFQQVILEEKKQLGLLLEINDT